MIFDGCREDWEQPPPRSPLLLAREVVNLAIRMVAAVSLTFLGWALIG